jgi:hypothetical protein
MGSAALRAEPVLRRPGSLSGLGRSLLRRRERARGMVRPVWGRRLLRRWMEQSLAMRRAMAPTVADERKVRGALVGAVADQDVLGGHRENGRDRRARIRPVPHQRPRPAPLPRGRADQFLRLGAHRSAKPALRNGRAPATHSIVSSARPRNQRRDRRASSILTPPGQPRYKPHILVFDKSKRTGSQWTRRWRKEDSNPPSLSGRCRSRRSQAGGVAAPKASLS